MNTPGSDRVVGRRLFTDGIERDVYEDGSGRQYVFRPDGGKVFGQKLLPADERARTDELSSLSTPDYTRSQGRRRPSGVVRKCKNPGFLGVFQAWMF
jgi:hypothetical protein